MSALQLYRRAVICVIFLPCLIVECSWQAWRHLRDMPQFISGAYRSTINSVKKEWNR